MRHTKSPVTTRSIVLDGMARKLALEDGCWRDLEQVAKENDLTVAELVDTVDASLGRKRNLTSALRTYVVVSRVRH